MENPSRQTETVEPVRSADDLTSTQSMSVVNSSPSTQADGPSFHSTIDIPDYHTELQNSYYANLALSDYYHAPGYPASGSYASGNKPAFSPPPGVSDMEAAYSSLEEYAVSDPVPDPDPEFSWMSSGSHQLFICDEAGCGLRFGRAADVDRHKRLQHREQRQFFCDYRRCSRFETPFYRQDHFRDHLRDFHKEDLVRRGTRRGTRDAEEWWRSRSWSYMRSNWWRCSKCLRRASVQVGRGSEDSDWTCRDCGEKCQTERKERRKEVD